MSRVADADNAASRAAAELAAAEGTAAAAARDVATAAFEETAARDAAIRAALEQAAADAAVAAAQRGEAAAGRDVLAAITENAAAIQRYTDWQEGAVKASSEAAAAIGREAAEAQILGYADYQAAAASAEATKASINQAESARSVEAAVSAARDTILGYTMINYRLAASQTKAAISAQDSGSAWTAVASWLAAVRRDTIGALQAVNIFGIGWTALHWIVAGSFELLAVLGPALIALGAGMAVAAQGAVNLASHMQAVYNATEATYPVFGKTTGDVLGLGHAFQTAQNQANPGVYEVFGAALNSLQGHMGMLAQAGLQVVHMFDQFSAKVTLDMQGAMGSEIQGLISNMVQDLQEFGQVLGNLGHALLNFASAMPGLAQVLLKIADAISRIILFASGFGPLITFGMALEEMYRWGGLAATMLVRLTGGMNTMQNIAGDGAGFVRRFGAAIATLVSQGGGFIQWIGSLVGKIGSADGAFARAGAAVESFGFDMKVAGATMSPGLVAAVAAGVGALVFLMIKLASTKDATEQWIASTDKAIQSASDMQVLPKIADTLQQSYVRLAQAQKQVADSSQHFHNQIIGGRVYLSQYTSSNEQAAFAVGELTAQQQHLIQTANTVRSNIGFLAGAFNTSRAAAMSLANAAGVNLQQAFYKGGQAALLALQQIINLERGLGAMSAPVGTLGNDMNVLGIQSQLAASKVQQLNQAWDQWISSVTGGMQALSQFETALNSMRQDASAASAGLTGSIGSIQRGVGGMTYTLKGFGPAAMQSWQQFTSAVTQGNTVLDQLRTGMAEGVVSNKTFTDSVRGMVGQMAPFTQGNRAAVAMLRQLAAEAGGPANGSLQQLEHWAGVSGRAARDLLGKGLVAATIAMSNMGKVAANLSADLSGQVDSAIAKTIYNTSGLAKAVAQYSKDAQAAHPSQVRMHSDLQGIAAAMQRATTEGGQFAKSYTHAQTAASGAAASVAKSTSSIVNQTSAAAKAQATILMHTAAMDHSSAAASTLADHTTTLASNTMTAAQRAQQAAQNTQDQGNKAAVAAGQIQHMAQQVLTAGGNSLTAAGKMITLAAGEGKAGSAAATAAGQVRGLQAAISALQSKTVTITTNYVSTGSSVAHHAAGTNYAAPGLAMINEQGPEMMLFNGGEQVFSASQTAAIMAMAQHASAQPAASMMGGAAQPAELHSNIYVHLDGHEIWRGQQRETLQYNVRNGGAQGGAWAPSR